MILSNQIFHFFKSFLARLTPRTRRAKVIAFSSYLLASCFLLLFFGYHLAYARKIIPHVYIGTHDFGNKTKKEAYEILKKEFSPTEEVIFYWEDKTFKFSPKEVGFRIDTLKTVDMAFKVGRSGKLITDTKTKFSAWFQGEKLEPTYSIDQKILDKKIFEAAVSLDRQPKDSAFVLLEEGTLSIVEEKEGLLLDQKTLVSDLTRAFLYGQKEPEKFPVKSVSPKVSKADLKVFKERVESTLAIPPTLVYGEKFYSPSKNEILSFLSFETGKIIFLEGVANDYVKGVADEVDQSPRGEVFKLDGKKVVEFLPSQRGLALDREKVVKVLGDTILDSKLARQITLPVIEVTPPGGSNSFGIKELLGEGKSGFAGSIPGRIQNIVTASGRLSGVLVPPGEVFSFNKELGEVTTKTGYAMAYIIQSGRTVLGEGGGVCQVSTTLFRAAFWAGLPIEERFAHDYRVGYYEPPLGLDATVFEPTADLKFKNDTSAYILVQSSWDLQKQTLTFQIFGTSDGRKVEMEGPIIHSQSPAPAPLYEDDPTLPKGVTKQVDFSAGGAAVTVKRKVTRGDEVLQEDSFYSNYRPWRAIFKVGTKE